MLGRLFSPFRHIDELLQNLSRKHFIQKYYTLVHQWQFSCMKNQIAQQGWIHLNTILKNISPCSYITWDVNILAKEHQLSQLHTTIKERKHSFVESISNSLGIVSFLFIMLSISLSSNSFRYKEKDKLRQWSTQMILSLAIQWRQALLTCLHFAKDLSSR